MKLIILLGVVATAAAVTFDIKNDKGEIIWIGIQGGNQRPPLENGGFILRPGESKSVNSDANWEGRFWARTGCDDKTKHCKTGDCGNRLQCKGNGGAPPATLVEIKLNGDGGKDYYDISLVDGFNTKASIRPVNGKGDCPALDCSTDINSRCPEKLKVPGGCKSACLHFNTDQTCCRTAAFEKQKCQPNTWPINSAKVFKDACPKAYSYAYDDKSSLKTCSSNNYKISFF